jgi:hypothetical protein
MNLRPRYSLLTLLVVTALVAGGVMYFLVPHRAMISDPPTADEQRHLDVNYFVRETPLMQHSAQLEYEYVYTRGGPRWLSLAGQITAECMIYAQKVEKYQCGLLHESWSSKRLALDEQQYDRERVVAWVMSDEYKPPEPPSPKLLLYSFSSNDLYTNRDGLYLLTDQQRIWIIEQFGLAKSVTLSEIPDDHLRVRLAEELAKIPAPAKSR